MQERNNSTGLPLFVVCILCLDILKSLLVRESVSQSGKKKLITSQGQFSDDAKDLGVHVCGGADNKVHWEADTRKENNYFHDVLKNTMKQGKSKKESLIR